MSTTAPGALAGRAWPVPARAAGVVLAGLAAGALTSILQKYLNSPWLSLVNSASPWLAVMFAAGLCWRGPRAAAVAGLLTGLAELAGYYVTAAARGYAAGSGILLFWAACAVIGGPVFGAAGWLWWRGPARWRLAGAVLPAAIWAEAGVVYAWRLHYYSSAVLFALLGAAAFAGLGARGRAWPRLAAGLAAALPAAVVAELALDLVYRQTF